MNNAINISTLINEHIGSGTPKNASNEGRKPTREPKNWNSITNNDMNAVNSAPISPANKALTEFEKFSTATAKSVEYGNDITASAPAGNHHPLFKKTIKIDIMELKITIQ